jgi:hypothetical protein
MTLLLLLSLLLSLTRGLLFSLPLHAQECFFEQHNALGAKCAVQFEVQRSSAQLDVDVDIYDASGTAIYATHAQAAGVAVFSVEMSGEANSRAMCVGL